MSDEICTCEGLAPHRHCPYCYDAGYFVEGYTAYDWEPEIYPCQWCYENEDCYYKNNVVQDTPPPNADASLPTESATRHDTPDTDDTE